MTILQFKNEFLNICVDPWDDALDAWLECAGRLYMRNELLPTRWEYRPGSGSQCQPESRFYEPFAESSNEELYTIGAYLFRYLRFLEYKGLKA